MNSAASVTESDPTLKSLTSNSGLPTKKQIQHSKIAAKTVCFCGWNVQLAII